MHDQTGTGRADAPFWLDRRPWLALLILILTPLLGHLPSLLTGLSSNPIWSQSNAVLGTGPSLIVGGDFGDPNVGWTNQALGHLAAQDWLHFKLPWWNPYSGVGLPLAGEMQPAALFLPFVLLLALQNGMFWIEVSLQIFAGIATYALLRRLDMGRLTALVGGLLYAFSGTFAWVPGETILNVVPFLPLLLHGIEDARDPAHHRRAILLVGLGIGGSILAGFPEAAYIDGWMALLWAGVRLFQSRDRRGFMFAVAAGGILGLLIAAPQIVAFADFSAASSVFTTHEIGRNFIPPRGLAVLVLPYVFGALGNSLGSSLLLSVSGGPGGYIGLLPLLFGVAGLFSHRDRPIAWLLAVWLALSIGKSFGLPPAMALINALPLMKEVMFWRYSSQSWELAVIVLACFAFEDARTRMIHRAVPFAIIVAIVAVCIGLAWPWARVWHWSAGNLAFMVRWLEAAAGFELFALGLTVLIWLRLQGETRRQVAGMVLVMNAMLLFMLPQLSGPRPGWVDWPAIRFLHSHLRLRRFYTLGPIAPNYSAYFDIPNLNHNYLPTALNWSEYVHSHIFSQLAARTGNIFYAPFPPMSVTVATNDISRFRQNYRALGVRYIVANADASITPTVADPATLLPAIGHPVYPGHSLTLHGTAPKRIASMGSIDRLGVYQGNYDHAANGIMAFRLCAGGQCASGAGNLVLSNDGVPFTVRLTPGMTLHPGERFTLTLDHRSGTSADAIWLYPSSQPGSRIITGSGTIIHGRTFGLAFGRAGPPGRFTKVYGDRLVTIWRLSGAAPFYTGSNCIVRNAKLDRVTMTCRTRSTLIRRELFMAGWHVSDDGVGAVITRHRGIVQAVALHPGTNRLVFRFAPPYSGLAGVGFWLGVAGLLWQGCGRWIISQRQRLRVSRR